MKLSDVLERSWPAVPWEDTPGLPWGERGFSERVLGEHLSQETDLATRTTPHIHAHVDWLIGGVLGKSEGRVLDLGCGPGLYLHELARRGVTGHGVDLGPASIDHAREVADDEGLACTFEVGDVTRAAFDGPFDLIMMIFGQYNVFTREQALDFTQRAHQALAPGGKMVVEPQGLE